jgi:hypothetical protein
MAVVTSHVDESGTKVSAPGKSGKPVHMIRILATSWKWAWVDILVTGFVLGGGSKNLHDFIGTLQAKSGGSNGSAASDQAAASTT